MAFSTLDTPTQLSLPDAEDIRATARWARTIAVLGFILLGLMLIMGVFFGGFMGRMVALSAANSGRPMPFDPSFLGIFYALIFLVVALIYFFPALFLYRYATRTLKALNGTFDGIAFSAGLRAHRSCYGYIGVLTIITLVMNLLGMIGLCVASVMLSRVLDGGGGMPM